jgi:hypothetical protein
VAAEEAKNGFIFIVATVSWCLESAVEHRDDVRNNRVWEPFVPQPGVTYCGTSRLTLLQTRFLSMQAAH